jgi:predicted nucleic acid-binding protein
MDIILDSNIFRSDLSLKSDEFKILIDYLNKTKSSVILPEIVLQEIKELYRRDLTSKIDKHRNASKELEKSLFSTAFVPSIISIDIESEVENYVRHVKETLCIDQDKIIAYKEQYLAEVVRRATLRQKPCGSESQGFRDAIVWLTLLDYAASSDKPQIAFVSDNIKDFAADDKSSLHEILSKEASERGVKVNYYRNVDKFLSEHQSKVDYITNDWIKDQLNSASLSANIVEILNQEDEEINNWFIKKFSRHRVKTDYFKVYEFILHDIYHYDVYELENNEIIIKGEMGGEIMIEIETIFLDLSKSAYKLSYNTETKQLERIVNPDVSFAEKQDFQFQVEESYPEIVFDVTLKLENGSIKELTLNYFDLF